MEQVTVKNDRLRMEVLDYGAIIQRLQLRDARGAYTDLVVGLQEPEAYLADQAYLGACVGRFAGRISGGVLRVGNENHRLSHRDGITLHGGERGFGKRTWKLEAQRTSGDTAGVLLSYFSPDGEEGFPGNLRVRVLYQISGNSLLVRHQAVTDRPTVVSLANHSYFKIDSSGSIDHYRLRLNARERLETDQRLLPTGRILDISQTEFDFRQEREIGATRLDTPYILNGAMPAAELLSPESKIRMQVTTNQPAVVVYTPPHFPGICFETQGYPDAPNHPGFPSTELHPGEEYLNESRFTFEYI
ncbi:aldose epimerase family protein [Robiginitalea sp. SC105]|uniref:aldose epimerase family protein n=1 Tax=Robiginitalea sp. SC105 TaxID=2762332 RepID=UPI00163B51D3|nr:aldose epimerase family protein [Robiginitalea sp. SC105]MBC2839983.1 galactose mutarotase [Robiginitalea sp. SC105]